FEAGIRSGGIGEHIASRLLELRYQGKYQLNAIDGCFVPHQTVAQALKEYGLDTEAIVRYME
ncbi:MAG: hypothetical protein IKN39_02645, partial [Clostridia bacterium]|nr:hypothetical protein [Clostridia bacterium]